MAVITKDKDGNIVPVDSDLVTEVVVSEGTTVELNQGGNKSWPKTEFTVKMTRWPGMDTYQVIGVGRRIVGNEVSAFEKKLKGTPVAAKEAQAMCLASGCGNPVKQEDLERTEKQFGKRLCTLHENEQLRTQAEENSKALDSMFDQSTQDHIKSINQK